MLNAPSAAARKAPARKAPARKATAAACGIALALTLAACSNQDANQSGSASSAGSAADSATASASQADSQAAFPVSITHHFGTTTIDKAPTRVATVGWANHEVPLALGIVPVGISKATWGDDDNNGLLPWVEEKLAELGAETPELFDETDGIPFEQVAATKPDVILAAYSGLTQEDYDTLSKIAPVVAYPDVAWSTSLEQMIDLNSTALGKQEEGAQLVKDLDSQVAAALDKHPKLKGTKVLFTAFGGTTDASKLGFYPTVDPRMGFLADHGFGVPAIVEENSRDAEKFWVEVSAENPEQFEDVELIIAYSSGKAEDDAKLLADLQKDPLKSKIPAIKNGNVAFIDNGPLGASANPSPLSIPWSLDKYFAALEAGLQS